MKNQGGMIKVHDMNRVGRDIAVGDIHGCFSALELELERIQFDRSVDRLFSVGDLVDRGPECERVMEWLRYPWFHPVRGNHDDYVCRFDTCDIGNWMQNGGVWFVVLPRTEQLDYQSAFREIPLAQQVETDMGLIGMVHADPCVSSWGDLGEFMGNRLGRNSLMWSRKRMEQDDESVVEGVDYVIVGHTPLPGGPVRLGNVLHIDTAGWHKSGRFTLLCMNTLEIL